MILWSWVKLMEWIRYSNEIFAHSFPYVSLNCTSLNWWESYLHHDNAIIIFKVVFFSSNIQFKIKKLYAICSLPFNRITELYCLMMINFALKMILLLSFFFQMRIESNFLLSANGFRMTEMKIERIHCWLFCLCLSSILKFRVTYFYVAFFLICYESNGLKSSEHMRVYKISRKKLWFQWPIGVC